MKHIQIRIALLQRRFYLLPTITITDIGEIRVISLAWLNGTIEMMVTEEESE